MRSSLPYVSIGLPVHNGERFLTETLDSLLAQTFEDFELIISDNASTDRTQEICKDYATKDRRIRYYRNDQNLGAARNYNRVFELSTGKYFKWAAHDDLCASEYLERCVEVLDQDASVVLCYARTRAVDEHGTILQNLDAKPKLSSSKPPERFYECVCVSHPQVPVFGVIRAGILKKTRLIDNYESSDKILLGELTLLGRYYEIPEYLFFKRGHPQQYWRVYPTGQSRQEWYDPARAGKITFPHWRLLLEHFISIGRAPLHWYERTLCCIYLGWWVRLHWRYLVKNLILKEPKES